jgi:hypothetical protein
MAANRDYPKKIACGALQSGADVLWDEGTPRHSAMNFSIQLLHNSCFMSSENHQYFIVVFSASCQRARHYKLRL